MPIKYAREFWGLLKVGRRYGRALKLEKENQLQKAYEVADEALSILWNLNSTNPPVLSLVVVLTTLLDRIAERLGKPNMTHTAIATALELCRQANCEDVEPGDALKEHVDWLKHRFSQQGTNRHRDN